MDVIDLLSVPRDCGQVTAWEIVVSLRIRLGPTDLAVRIAEIDPDVNATDEVTMRRWIEDDLSAAEVPPRGNQRTDPIS